MVALWYLLVLVPPIAIVVLWWNYRRKADQREHVAGARWEQMMQATQSELAGAPENQSAGNGAAVLATPAAPGYTRRGRMLDPVETVVYFLLKNGLPDHEIMPHVGLASLLELSGSTAVQRRDLLSHRVDFVICNKAMQPVAAIDLMAHEIPAALTSAPDFKNRCLAHTGIRHIRWVRTALPKRDAVRELVLGI